MLSPATKNHKLKTRPGLGLLETIVAMSILVTGIVSLMSMVVSASTARQANELVTVAANLAREGVEAVVAKRNNNWINELAFDNGMNTGTDYTFAASFDPSTLAWALVNNPAGGNPNLISDPLAKVYQYSSGPYAGLYAQGTVAVPQPASTVETVYRRLVTLDPICLNDTDRVTETTVVSGSNCGVGTTKVGVRVTSLVQWTDHDATRSMPVIETIYDWR